MPWKPADAAAPGRCWKVGELAERTGLTVRTLHHYDAMGLLSPRGRTSSAHGSGHRLYTAADVARLQQIVSLKQLGFGLEQIRKYLARADYDPRQVIRLHLARIREQAAELKRLEERLAALSDALDKAEIVSADEFLTTIKEMIVRFFNLSSTPTR
jgi:DNA-binding transcriptional MerR regulator